MQSGCGLSKEDSFTLQIKLLHHRNIVLQVITHKYTAYSYCLQCSLQTLPFHDFVRFPLQVQYNALSLQKEQEEAHHLHLMFAHERSKVGLLASLDGNHVAKLLCMLQHLHIVPDMMCPHV